MRSSVCDPFRTDPGRHIAEKNRLFRAVIGPVGHVGRKIVHFPTRRDGEMQRIELAADKQHAILAIHLVGAATIEIRDNEQFDAGQRLANGIERER